MDEFVLPQDRPSPTVLAAQQGSPEDNTILRDQVANLWWLVSGILVFLMQPGFAMVEVGQVRIKAGPNLLLKNVLDTAVGSLMWWAVGYGIAYGSGDGFMGKSDFLSINHPSGSEQHDYWGKWFFQWAFASAAATIVSGALAERCQFRAYIIYTIVLSGFIYPVVAHWVWSTQGWLSSSRVDRVFEGTNGLLDFAGSGVVHMVGGGVSLVGAAILGPRFGRFNNQGESIYIPGQSTALATLGTFLLWVAWYGFNCGSVQQAYGHMEVSARVAVTTTLSTAAGCISTLFFNSLWGYPLHISPALNGLLGGAVAVTAGCPFVEPYAAFIIGVVSGFVYSFSSRLLRNLQIDDPVDASPIHFFCGAWGVLAVGLFATKQNIQQTYDFEPVDYGIIYGGSGQQLAIQLLGILTISAWTLIISLFLFGILKYIGWFRIPIEDEINGLNISMNMESDFEMNMHTLHMQQLSEAERRKQQQEQEELQRKQQQSQQQFLQMSRQMQQRNQLNTQQGTSSHVNLVLMQSNSGRR
eukprot:TRINITY_DN5548_c0_g1_i4.p1 TRINITY_DN5548_c0_g1~~TRINITY_DN5548_c0_g1_i4.p1  ORF type:complete len:551 (+),score=31.60 TRINITY_DN5548_c0_g1_i4:79-1653(+)